MHRQKSKKIFAYFFLLFVVGSINNSTIREFKFEKIKYIEILGLNYVNKEQIKKDIKDLKLENIFSINKKDIVNIIKSNPLVESFEIFKKYPSTLYINIKETKLIAKINKHGQTFYIGANGKLSTKKFLDEKLPFIFGKPSTEEFLQFKKKIDQSNFPYEDIKNLYFFPSKRWDIELKNEIIIKLPKENISNSLENIFSFLNNDNINSIKTIDARVKNQIILND
tara:strand:+ start:3076 stop:3747 length:672 start_codon:yes stop_codon:yes gene_type:complete